MRYLLLITALFFSACTNDKQIIKETKQNSNRHYELSKTYYKNLNSAIVFIKDDSFKNTLSYIIDIKPKDIDNKISITSCTINKKSADITEESVDKYASWSSRFRVSSYQKAKKVNNITCKLSNNESIKFNISLN